MLCFQSTLSLFNAPFDFSGISKPQGDAIDVDGLRYLTDYVERKSSLPKAVYFTGSAARLLGEAPSQEIDISVVTRNGERE